jgi:hypothetical protein
MLTQKKVEIYGINTICMIPLVVNWTGYLNESCQCEVHTRYSEIKYDKKCGKELSSSDLHNQIKNHCNNNGKEKSM